MNDSDMVRSIVNSYSIIELHKRIKELGREKKQKPENSVGIDKTIELMKRAVKIKERSTPQ